MVRTLSDHWPEYLCEAFGLALFMVSAALFAALLEHPTSPVRHALPDPVSRRALMGVAMGLTGILNVYSPWGRRSGCHLNPAVTLTFACLGKVAWRDAVPYIVAQFIGGTLGLAAAGAALGQTLAHPSVGWVATTPGPRGAGVAFVAEACISFGLMTLVLCAGNSRRTAPLTGVFVGLLIALYITFEAPLSGMSMNPARTLASAWPAQAWTGLWIYFTAPALGMGAAALTYRMIPGLRAVACAKLHHDTVTRCIFRCSFQPQQNGHV
jgi:aquaporin Z